MKKPLLLLLLITSVFAASAQPLPKNIDHYKTKLESAYKTKRIGSSLTAAGLLCGVVGGGILVYNNINAPRNYSSTNSLTYIGLGLFVGGGIMTNIGIPLWIAGSVKVNNNKAAILKEFRVSTHGLGLKLIVKL